uniref:Uncharacterized protein n=1 Tax=Photinus pyralis TaxID=7054 RepID=A0A1Y1LEE7_PHOPY
MNIISRFTAGKRLNLVQRGSYERRVHLAGLRHNKSFAWHYSPYKRYLETSPGAHFKMFVETHVQQQQKKEDRLARKRQAEHQNRPSEPAPKKRRKQTHDENYDYGPNAEEPEDEEVMEKNVEEVISSLQVPPTFNLDQFFVNDLF